MKFSTLLLGLFAFIGVSAQNNLPLIIPQPVDVKVYEGFFELTQSASLRYNQPDGQGVAQQLVQHLSQATGFVLKTEQGTVGTIQLNLNAIPDKTLGDEGYTLTSSTKNVVIAANKPAGLFNGVQTLYQLMPTEIESKLPSVADWKLPIVTITDYPRFAWRGMMFDVSRHFFTKEEVKMHIDQLSHFKINTFHWHLTDDNGWRIEIKTLPKLTEVGAWRVERHGQFGERSLPLPGEAATFGGFYTHEDIREIVQFAQERNVTIVPEIDVPGHCMAALAAYPELSCGKDKSTTVNPGTPFSEWYADGTFKMLIENTLNPSDEKVYEFLDKVFTEVAQLFPNPYIHVGGDECYKGYWANDEGCKALMKQLNLTKVADLQVYFMHRVNDILKSKGKKLLGWDEDGELSPGATVMSWRGFQGGIEAAKKGHDVVMTPSSFAYLDYVQGEPTIEAPVYASLRLKKCYSFEPVPDGVETKYILGGQGNLWTEQVPTLRYAQYMTYPRAWALAEVFWSPKALRNYDNFIQRVENQFQRADRAEINYSRAIYDPIITTTWKNDRLWLEIESEAPNLAVYFTLDGTMPDNFSKLYAKPFGLPNGPITLRIIAYRNGKPMGHLIILKRNELEKRATR
jgi:hexosaminidase